jgi:hypothetical protein
VIEPGLQREIGQGLGDDVGLRRIAPQQRALLDHRLRDRIEEDPLGQLQHLGRAAAELAQRIPGDQRELDRQPRPGAGGQVLVERGLDLALLGRGGQGDRDRRFVAGRPLDLEGKAGDAVIVLGLVVELERAALHRLARRGPAGAGRQIRYGAEGKARQNVAALPERQRRGRGQRRRQGEFAAGQCLEAGRLAVESQIGHG